MPVPASRARAQRIAMLVRSLGRGGEERTTISLAAEFASAGRQVHLYVAAPAGAADLEVPGGIAVHHLDGAPALTDALIRDPPDVLLSAGNAMAVAARAKAKLPEVPLIIRASSHPRRSIPWGRLRHRLLEPARRELRRRRYRAADLIIAVAEDVAAGVRQMAPAVPVIVLPSPVITPKFLAGLKAEAPDHPWLSEQVPIAVSVGRFAVPKDFPTLLRAFAAVRSERDLRLVILGDGAPSFRQELVRLARELGIDEDVDLPGWTDDVAAWLARASVFVSTSIWEGSPGAIIEALAAGCPIVATDCPGDTRHLLRHGELGGLAPIGDAGRIADLMEQQLDRPVVPAALKAAAAPYVEATAAAAHLEALDGFVAGLDLPLRSSRAPPPR